MNSIISILVTYYLRGGEEDNEGLDLNYLTFENKGFIYKIYEEYTEKNSVTEVGIRVINETTNKETVIKGLINSVEGSLISLRQNSKIKVNNSQ